VLSLFGGVFRTKFLQALNDSGLLDEIEGFENITVFAPTDEAWEEATSTGRLGRNATSNSSQSYVDEYSDYSDGGQRNDALRSILQMHIVNGSFYPTDLCEGGRLPLKYDTSTNLSVSTSGETMTVNGSRVIKKGVLLRNGHLIPPRPPT
jgi:uncharacterized surface protein with fasciclin (FAS1) repeats